MNYFREFYIQNPQNEIATATAVSASDPEVNPEITEEVRVIEYQAWSQLLEAYTMLRNHLLETTYSEDPMRSTSSIIAEADGFLNKKG